MFSPIIPFQCTFPVNEFKLCQKAMSLYDSFTENESFFGAHFSKNISETTESKQSFDPNKIGIFRKRNANILKLLQ